MSELSDERLDELERLAAEATPGPWDYAPCTIGHPDNVKNPVVGSPSNYIARAFSEDSTFTGLTSRAPRRSAAEANAYLIAAARNALPELVAALRKERAENERLNAALARTVPETEADKRLSAEERDMIRALKREIGE